jgi:hypothetical protein
MSFDDTATTLSQFDRRHGQSRNAAVKLSHEGGAQSPGERLVRGGHIEVPRIVVIRPYTRLDRP